MRIYCDIDGTICQTNGNDYQNAVPIQANIDKMNKLYNEGNVIIYWTARGSSSGQDLLFFTLKQLVGWGCKCNSVQVGKPSYDLFIDDKSKRIEEL